MGSFLSLVLGKKKTKEVIFLPEEMLIEILMRLPVNSLMRFKCVSKQWLSLISSRYMTNLFLKSCSSRLRSFAYFVDNKDNYALLASSPRDHFAGLRGKFVSAVRGLTCFTFENIVRICNLNTGQVVELPLMRSEAIGNIHEMHYFGHDPVHDEYKVLSVVFDISKKSSEHQVLVLGAEASWRNIQCHIPHDPYRQGMTINGVLYYKASSGTYSGHVLMSFDWSSEEFKLIELPNYTADAEVSWTTSLMNYREKIAIFERMNDGTVDIWVLEDAEKCLWSNKKTFVLPFSQMNVVQGDKVAIGGTSHSGKVWLAKVVGETSSLPLVHFFTHDLERNETAEKIEITTLDIFRTLGAIRGFQFLVYLDMNWLPLSFWDDSKSIMHFEI